MESVVAENTGLQEWQCGLCATKWNGTPISFQDYAKNSGDYGALLSGHVCQSCQFISCHQCDGFSLRSLYKKSKHCRCKKLLKNLMVILSPGKTFSCLIQDSALTGYEQLTVGILTGGAFRGNFRSAAVSFEGSELVIKAQTDVTAGGATVTVANIAVSDITEIRATPIPVDSQIKAVLARSLVVGGGFALFIVIAAFIGMSNSRKQGNPGVALLVAILGGLAVGFFFSFLPGYFKVKKDLSGVQFICKDDHVFPIALTSLQMKLAKTVLEPEGLHLTEWNKGTTSPAQ